MRFRVQKYIEKTWPTNNRQPGVVRLARMVDLVERTGRLLLKAIEVDARIQEGQPEGSDAQAAYMAYLRTLPAERLSELLLEGEMPRLDPGTGLLIEPGE